MSCRAFSRRVEHQCIRQLFSRFDFESLTIDFCQTERNGPVAEFLNSIGAKPENAGTVVYREEFERRCRGSVEVDQADALFAASCR